MKKSPRKTDMFDQLITLVVRGSLLVVLGVLLTLIYLPFSHSINQAFEPNPAMVVDNRAKTGSKNEMNQDRVVDGIHIATGMIYDQNFSLVKNACTSCHSAKLITQNRASREGWKQMIRWMQATQGLPDLGKSERKILDYLAKNYAPEESGRRKNLDYAEIEWYTLKID